MVSVAQTLNKTEEEVDEGCSPAFLSYLACLVKLQNEEQERQRIESEAQGKRR